LLFTITGKHVEISQDLRNHAEDKASKLPKYYDSINRVEVIIEAGKGVNTAVEVIARAEHSKVFVGKEAGDDVYRCIDLAIHKIEEQLRRQKEKERDNKHKGVSGKI